MSLILRFRLDIWGGVGAAASVVAFFWCLSVREFGGAILSMMSFALSMLAMQAAIEASRMAKMPKPDVEPTPTSSGAKPGSPGKRAEGRE